MKTIELDCPPGNPRPDDLLPLVIEGTGLTTDDFQITSRVFGNWTFELKADKNDIFDANKEKISCTINRLLGPKQHSSRILKVM